MNKSNLSKWVSDDALRTINYILDRVPSKSVHKTSLELWTSNKPSAAHIFFGFLVEVRIYNPELKIIDPRTMSCLIGYQDRSKGHKFYLHDPWH